MKQQRDFEGSVREIELPFELLNKTSQTKLGRTPYEYEVVLLQIEKHALGQSFKIHRDLPELNSADDKKHQKEVDTAITKEWTSWNDHGTFKPRLRSAATNVIDARWVLKWKIVDGVKTVKARLCVRGCKDREADHVVTSASTAARWTQRMVVSMAANHGWKISLADVRNSLPQRIDIPGDC